MYFLYFNSNLTFSQMAVEVESAGGILAHYAKFDSQQDKPKSVPMRPFLRWKMLSQLKGDKFMVIDKENPSRRVERFTADFTEGGLRCIQQLVGQIELRLPTYDTSDENMVVFLDPVTKQFVDKVFDKEEIESLIEHFKKAHRKWFRISELHHVHDDVDPMKVEKMLEPDQVKEEKVEESADVDEKDFFDGDDDGDADWEVGADPDPEDENTVEAIDRKADAEVDRWLQHKPLWNKFKYDGESRLLPSRPKLNALVDCFDTMKYLELRVLLISEVFG